LGFVVFETFGLLDHYELKKFWTGTTKVKVKDKKANIAVTYEPPYLVAAEEFFPSNLKFQMNLAAPIR
jgi:hypothetical protein